MGSIRFFLHFLPPTIFLFKEDKRNEISLFFLHFSRPTIFSNKYEKTSSDCCPLQRCDLDGDGKLNYDEFIRCHFVIFIGPESYHWLPYSLTYLLTHSLTYSFNSLTNSLLFSRLDWCNPGVWRCQLKDCWGCYCSWFWWEKRVDDSLVRIWRLNFGKKNGHFRSGCQGGGGGQPDRPFLTTSL